ncbi:amidohydrolase family protein [Speluncibacter jeojiensis]|uniref:Amidohydrolase family protein n=1 Tax=Speluncibacter jeojiensis TaxID=2710754 RepID=A0A9X4M8W1_9ACTN|nr:amidohydrolase family protein [Corynebacteriales bacterium D3-21]
MFDAHCHIIDPRFPLIADHGYLPDPFTIADYRARTAGLGITGGAVVSGSFQGTDQGYLRTALAELGPGWVGVATLPADASDKDITELDRAGVRGVRFNLVRGNPDLALVERQAMQAHDVAGWHAEFYLNSADLPELAATLAKLPQVCIDHLGLSDDGLFHLLSAVDWGVRVKASGFGRVEVDVAEALRTIHTVSPDALMFGTDLPGTRAPRPFRYADLDQLADAVGVDLPEVLCHNARQWYRV